MFPMKTYPTQNAYPLSMQRANANLIPLSPNLSHPCQLPNALKVFWANLPTSEPSLLPLLSTPYLPQHQSTLLTKLTRTTFSPIIGYLILHSLQSTPIPLTSIPNPHIQIQTTSLAPITSSITPNLSQLAIEAPCDPLPCPNSL